MKPQLSRVAFRSLCAFVAAVVLGPGAAFAQQMNIFAPPNLCVAMDGITPEVGTRDSVGIQRYCHGHGAIFRVSEKGVFTEVHAFTGADGSGPRGRLLIGRDGNYYGATTGGGKRNVGVVFQMTPKGVVRTIYDFAATVPDAIVQTPTGNLIQGTDGNLYGVTIGVGLQSKAGVGSGTVFRLTLNGQLTILHTFYMPDGIYPYMGLAQGPDDSLYGTTSQGGPGNNGTVFNVAMNGFYKTIYSFAQADGAPVTNLKTSPVDGTVYGMTQKEVFAISPLGVLRVIARFRDENAWATGGANLTTVGGGFIDYSDGTLVGVMAMTPSPSPLDGKLFQLTIADGSMRTLHEFKKGEGVPTGDLTVGNGQMLYGTNGAVFSIHYPQVPTAH